MYQSPASVFFFLFNAIGSSGPVFFWVDINIPVDHQHRAKPYKCVSCVE
jgi:hypothetical protein